MRCVGFGLAYLVLVLEDFCCNDAVHVCCAEAEVLEQLVLEGEEGAGEGTASFHVFAVFVSSGLVGEQYGDGAVGVSEGVIVVCEGEGGMSLSFGLAEKGFSSSCHRGEDGEREEAFVEVVGKDLLGAVRIVFCYLEESSTEKVRAVEEDMLVWVGGGEGGSIVRLASVNFLAEFGGGGDDCARPLDELASRDIGGLQRGAYGVDDIVVWRVGGVLVDGFEAAERCFDGVEACITDGAEGVIHT